MASRQGYLGGQITNTNRVSCGLTMPSGEFPVKITGFSGTLYAANASGNITVTLCDSSGGNAYTMATIASNGTLKMVLGNNSPTYSAAQVRATGLIGKAIYIQVRGLGTINTNDTSGRVITIETSDKLYTAVTAGNKIMASDFTQTGGSATVGNTISNSNFSSGTKAEASTFNSKVLQL